MSDDPDVGGEPELVVRCAECGNTYPAQRGEDGGFRPIGTAAGTCSCGSSEFEQV
ncbi:hypothetical protein [Halobaculum sp. D14]|uniref:hypothetical protein n=1 Tax=Halobaculum sp. D14 TaxID=3421642 RepID=UPI003EC0CE5C